jgi:endogenous inhibitor of DNA gyrase (YacG/DUF329 family)
MPIQRTTLYCPVCGAKLFGRLDKIFCSSSCRSIYFRHKAEKRKPITREIDNILHRNWTILSEHFQVIGRRKFFVEVARLNRQGFHLNYYTTSMVNRGQKRYYYVYDFAWMRFSEKELMVIKLERPK